MKVHLAFSAAVLLLVLAATATGIFYRTPGPPIEHVTARGQRVVLQGSGLYRYDPAWFAREGMVWDAINLAVGAPLLAVAIVLTARGSLRGRLLLAGLLFYFFYVYLSLMAGYALNAMFLVYVAVIGLGAVAFFATLGGIDVGGLPARISPRFPRRVFIGFALTVSVILTVLWLGRILPVLRTGRFPPELAGVHTLISQGLDLGLVVPLMLATAVLLRRRAPWGYVLAAVSLTYGLLMSLAIPAWIVVPLVQDGRINPVEAAPFLAISLAGIVLAARFFAAVESDRRPRGPHR